jgi:hypothetical protein
MGPDQRRRPPRRRDARTETRRRSCPRSVPPDRCPRERIGFPDALPARTLRTALWQRLAGEVAGLIRCARCPAPSCGRWFLKGDATRSDRQFCSPACRIRTFRRRSDDKIQRHADKDTSGMASFHRPLHALMAKPRTQRVLYIIDAHIGRADTAAGTPPAQGPVVIWARKRKEIPRSMAALILARRPVASSGGYL